MTSWRAVLLSLLVGAGCSDAGPSAQAKADMCEAISTEYEAAVVKAEECTLGGADPCTKVVAASFYCRCQVQVSGDTATLAAIDARFSAAGCMGACLGSCARRCPATCQADPTSSTGARCLPGGIDCGA